jgi:peroxiredoxin Q/BCP
MSALHKIIKNIPSPAKQAIKDQLYPELLAEGETAPEWQLQSWDDSWHRMKKKWSLLVFYPGDDTPGCTAQLQDFQNHFEQLKEIGCDVFAINPAEASSHKAFAEKYAFEFPILTDRGSSVSRRFKASLSIPFKTRIIRTVYLVNPERKIRLANRGNPSVAAIVRSIQALQQATKDGM